MKRFLIVTLVAIAIVFAFVFQAATSPNTQQIVVGAESDPVPYMEYQVYNDTIYEDPIILPLLPGGWGDYTPLFENYNLCDLVVSGEIDEIWIWAGNGDGVTLGHLWEWTTTGPGWTGLTPDCGEVVTTMVFNYTGVGKTNLHTYGHRMEGLMGHSQPCDISTENWPWDALGDPYGTFEGCEPLLSDTYGFVARPFPGNNHIGGCGDVHFPPNITQEDNREYIYNELAFWDSICLDWSMDGSAVPTEINCQDWGCTAYGYHIWWLQNFPGLNNTNRDRNGAYQPNWWDYLFDGAYAPTPTPTVTPTQTPTATPTATPTPTTIPVISTDLDEYTFLPAVVSELTPVPSSAFTNAHVATQPQAAPFLRESLVPNSIIENVTLTAGEAIVKPVVFVLYLTAYEVNGPPRDDIQVLNDDLIATIKEATIYHGYLYTLYLKPVFLGQDGASFAGVGCTTGTEPDNAHIQLTNLKTDVQAISYRVDDMAGGGVWATPCDPASNWLLHAETPIPGTADLYFKPFRDAPEGTVYHITITYEDGSIQSTALVGSQIAP